MAFKNNVALLLVTIMVMNGHASAFRADMKRVHGSNITSSQRLRAAVQRSSARLKKIGESVRGKAPDMDRAAPVNRATNPGEFLITMAIGTPPRKMVAILDTGSDLIWTQCQPCKNCYTQPDPIFDPSKSSTYAKVPCNSSLCYSLPRKTCPQDCQYVYSYGESSNTTGILSNETLTLWDTSGNQHTLAEVTFGCSHDTPPKDGFTEADGVVGLGRGSLSLVSQMGSSVGSRFSYCLTSFLDNSPSDTSPLFFGDAANLTEKIGVQSTPLIKNLFRPDLNSFYYISVTAIGVREREADIPLGTFDIQRDGSGGFIIDSGSAVSYLAPAALAGVAELIDRAMGWDRADGSDYGFSLCYQRPDWVTHYEFPNITFYFSGGAEYLVDQKYNFQMVDEQSGLLCMLILETETPSSPSVLGNYHQQDYHILYDNGNQTLSFVPASCANLFQPAFDQSFPPANSTDSPANSTGSPANFSESSANSSELPGQANARLMVSCQLIVAFVISISLLVVRF